ncbi:MAG TPA: hypothetical protein VLB02_01840 [Candidatus Paceibacterota bacterium]|nr:hypothetical protein [Candidatus Paceibacterota bacterium]
MKNQKPLLIVGYALCLFFSVTQVHAATILSTHTYAWSDQVGYINFEHVTVEDDALAGYAWSANKGFIVFDPLLGGVANDGSGNLSGAAWGEQLGWIDFGNVNIDTDGVFSGTATGTLVGTLTFDCPTYCDVQTDWRAPASSTLSSSSGRISGSLVAQASSAFSENVPNTPFNSIPSQQSESSEELSVTKKSIELVFPNEPVETPALFDVISELLVSKVAPGDDLPVLVKLSNFGGNKRVDVLIAYSVITNHGVELYKTTETVAVETTANFVKKIHIPVTTAPSSYTIQTAITYEGQLVSATAQLPFTVERKILGLFQSSFYRYSAIAAVAAGLAWLFGYLWIRRRRNARLEPIDYSAIPRGERTFYEIISDTITQMRGRVGDEALTIAAQIPGLEIDHDSGRVLAITGPPAKIVATLVSEYETLLGKKVSFSFRKETAIKKE